MTDSRVLSAGHRWRGPYADALLLSAIVLVAAVLRFTGLAQESLWLDEQWSRGVVIGASMGDVIVRVGGDQHPPLYFVTLWGWCRLFGYSAAALRSLSATMGVASVIWIALVTRRVAGRWPTLCAAFLLSISSQHLFWSQEARQYGMLALATVAAIHAGLVYASGPSLRSGSLLALAALAVLYTHNYGLLIVPCVLLAVVWQKCVRLARGGGSLWAVVLTILVGYSPWMPFLLRQVQAGGPEYLRGSHPSVTSIAYVLAMPVWGFGGWGNPVWGRIVVRLAAVASLVAIGLGLWSLRRQTDRASWLVLALGGFGPLVLSVLVSIVVGQWSEKSLLPVGVVSLVYVAVGLCGLRSRAAQVAFLAALTGPSMVGLVCLKAEHEKEEWREVASFVRVNAREGDSLLITTDFAGPCFDYYYDGLPLPRVAVSRDIASPAALGSLTMPTLRSSARIWFVESHARPSLRDFLASQRGLRSVLHREWIGIRLTLFEVSAVLPDDTAPGEPKPPGS